MAGQADIKAASAAARNGWLFTLCFVMAQADKQVMGLLAIPVQDHFSLSNAELGFLQGGAFAIAFALGGLPVGRLLDTGNRVKIAAACVALWSLTTLGSGFATSFAALLFFRAATAVAEAGLPPAAFSVFAQSGDRRSLVKLTSGFMLAPYVGGGLVLLLGGQLLGLFSSGDGGTGLPGLSEPWRAVLVAVGAPGLILALLLWKFGVEPARNVTPQRADLPSMWTVVKTIFVHTPFLRYYYLATTSFYLLAAAMIAWYPAFLVRGFEISTTKAGALAGLSFLIAGVAGTLSVNLLSRVRSTIDHRTIARDFVIAAAVLVPLGLAVPLAGSVGVSVSLYALYAFAAAVITSTMSVPIQLYLPEQMRARGTAIASLLMSGVAGTLGPILVGLLVDRAALSLGSALAVVGGISSLSALVFFAIAWRRARPA